MELSIHDHHLGCFTTYSRNVINIRNPKHEDINIIDIAHALSNICRFGGHSNLFYSVAQHSVLVAALAPQKLKLAALLHDAAEAYLGDVIKPLKVILGNHYKQFEDNFELLICQRFGLTLNDIKAVKKYDVQALELENEALKHDKPAKLVSVLEEHNLLQAGWAWSPAQAETEFMIAFEDLYGLYKQASELVCENSILH